MKPLSALVLTLLLVTTFSRTSAQAPQDSIRITPLESGVDASFRGMDLANSREAWIAGSKGTVIRTTDSGRSWQRIPVPDAEQLDFRDVELLRDGTVLLMSVGNGSASKVLRSADAGVTWHTVLVNSEVSGFFDGMAFRRNGLRGVLFGDPVDGRLDLFMTFTGGKTWTRFPWAQRPKLKDGEYGFAASGTGVVTMGSNIWIATGGSTARVWHSRDEGRTWNPYETEIRSKSDSSGIFSIDVTDDGKAVAIGGDYVNPDLDDNNVATSSDNGRSWRIAPKLSMPHKACVQFLDADRLITCGRTGVAFSADAGQTWTTISSESYYTLRVDHGSGSGFLAGKDGRVARFQLSRNDKSSTED